jgi:spore maturation protein CgeB
MDMGHWYVYLPLRRLGHEVYFYDTVEPEEKDYKKIIEEFKPDLIYCCLTGNKSIAPHEPWKEILDETNSGRTKTFNWFCDDTWRFDNFSSKACSYFSVCSTPEPAYIEKFKSIGYDKILLGSWHANSEIYSPKSFSERDIDIGFVGTPTLSRRDYLVDNPIPVEIIFNVSTEEIFAAHSRTKIGLNLSVNDNDPEGGTQMKQRIFEIIAGGGTLLTQYHKGIENFFEIDKEIVTFETMEEFNKKAKFLSKNERITKSIAKNGYQRLLDEHDSKIRLSKLLKQIEEI